MHRRLSQGPLRRRRHALQELRLRLQRTRHPMDLHRLATRRIQARLHGRHLRGLRFRRRSVRAERKLWRGIQAHLDGQGRAQVRQEEALGWRRRWR